MDISVETIQMAEDILSSIDANEEFMEHHGVKGQKHGVRRYQNDDGSLTALGRQHYGIFGRLRSHFNPAERGYRATVKQKQQQQEIAVKKAKYAGDIKKMMKKRKYFTDEEIERQIDTDTRLQQKRNRLNELMRADKIKRKEEKIAEKERKEAIKESKLQQELQKEAIKSQEKQHKLEQKTLLDVQKQKDKAQAEREQAAREYQTQQEIAKGKTLLGRLQKGAKMTAAIAGIASSVSKTADIFKTMGFVPKKLDGAAEKINEAKEAVKKQAEKVTSKVKEKSKEIKNEPDVENTASGSKITDEKRLLPAPKDNTETKLSRKERKAAEKEKKKQEFLKDVGLAEEARKAFDRADKNRRETEHMLQRIYNNKRFGEGETSDEDYNTAMRLRDVQDQIKNHNENAALMAQMKIDIPKTRGEEIKQKFKGIKKSLKEKISPDEPTERYKWLQEQNAQDREGKRKQNLENLEAEEKSLLEKVKKKYDSIDSKYDSERDALMDARLRSEKKRNEERQAKIKERMEEQEAKNAEREMIRETKEQINEAKDVIKERYKLSGEPLSDAARAVINMSSDSLARMMNQPVAEQQHISVSKGDISRILNRAPTFLESLRSNSKIQHEDEDAGEIEDAE